MNINKKGFTLIELLIVVAIIGLLVTLAIFAYQGRIEKTRDVKRLNDLQQIENALSLYYSDNGEYPNRRSVHPWAAWISLSSDLAEYLDPLPLDPKNSGNYRYYYDADPGDNLQSYGLMVALEHSSRDDLEQGDNGRYDYMYEKGPQPAYCQQNFGENWWANVPVQNAVCESNS